MSEIGYCEGDACNREGCAGVIETRPPENCSCHINPPCSACTSIRDHCPDCDWEAADDPLYMEDLGAITLGDAFMHVQRKPRLLDPTKIDFVCDFHSGSSMIKEGVYPKGMDIKEVGEVVRGTFGGRFVYFGDGKFKYIAYTD